jgi:hypothetical protein
MRKLLLVFSMCAMMMLGLASAGWAGAILNDLNDPDAELRGDGTLYSYYRNSGDFMFFQEGNNEGTKHLAELTAFMLSEYDVELVRIEDMYVDWSEPNATSGTWNVTGGFELSYYVVKAANAFAMYKVDPANSNGSWSTYHLWLAGYGGSELEISHFTAYNPSVRVPEPSTFLLLGVGLAGLAFCARRRMKQ